MPRGRPRGTTKGKKYGPSRKTFIKKGKYAARQSNLVKMIKSIALGQSETKRIITSLENLQVYHNVPSIIGNLVSTTQGMSQISRVGDEVIGQYLKLKLWLSNKSDRPNVMWRVIVYCPRPGTTTLDWQTNSATNRIIAFVDTDKLNVIKQKILNPPPGDYSLESGAALKERSRYLTMNIPIKNQKISYFEDNGTVPKLQKHNICVAVIAYDAYGTLITDNIASYAFSYEFYFKDC